MECISCGDETEHSTTVFLGTKILGTGKGLDARYSYREKDEAICPDCIHKYENGFASIIFYLALQLGWLSVFQQGLASPIGILGMVIALFGIVKLIQKAVREVTYRMNRRAGMEAEVDKASADRASDAVASLLKKDKEYRGYSIRSSREHELHGNK